MLTIQQKLELHEKSVKEELATKVAKDRCTGVQTVCDINKNNTNLVEFERNCDSGGGPSK